MMVGDEILREEGLAWVIDTLNTLAEEATHAGEGLRTAARALELLGITLGRVATVAGQMKSGGQPEGRPPR